VGKTFNAIIKAGYYTVGFPPVSRAELRKNYIVLNGFLYGNYCLAYKEISGINLADTFLPGFAFINLKHSNQNYPHFRIILSKVKAMELHNLLTTYIEESKISIIAEAEQKIIMLYQKGGKNPVKKILQIFLPTFWLILILLDLLISRPEDYVSQPFGIGTISAFILAFAVGFATLVSNPFRKIFLKPGRRLEDVDRSVYSLLIFLILTLAGIWLMPGMI